MAEGFVDLDSGWLVLCGERKADLQRPGVDEPVPPRRDLDVALIEPAAATGTHRRAVAFVEGQGPLPSRPEIGDVEALTALTEVCALRLAWRDGSRPGL